MNRVRRPPLRVWLWTAATLVVVVVAVLAWRSSDAAATSSTTAAAPAPATGSPGVALSEAWSVAAVVPAVGGGPGGSTGPGGDVVEAGRVLLTRADGVAMADPVTGEEAWHYTRSGARLCGATAVDQLVVVLFSTGGRCNELTALRAGTGERLWYRSVGFRADATLASTDRIVLAASPTGLATVDPSGNNLRWHHAPPQGCRITAADAGSTGVVALQECAGQQQVVLLDGFDGTQKWVRDLGTGTAVLAGADGLVTLVVDGDLQALSAADGSTLSATTLPTAAPTPDERVLQTALGDTAFVWARGTVLALDTAGGGLRWSTEATGLPAAPDGKASPGTVLVPEGTALVTRDPATGAELTRSVVEPQLPTGTRTSVVGEVVVVSGPGTTTAYR